MISRAFCRFCSLIFAPDEGIDWSDPTKVFLIHPCHTCELNVSKFFLRRHPLRQEKWLDFVEQGRDHISPCPVFHLVVVGEVKGVDFDPHLLKSRLPERSSQVGRHAEVLPHGNRSTTLFEGISLSNFQREYLQRQESPALIWPLPCHGSVYAIY